MRVSNADGQRIGAVSEPLRRKDFLDVQRSLSSGKTESFTVGPGLVVPGIPDCVLDAVVPGVGGLAIDFEIQVDVFVWAENSVGPRGDLASAEGEWHLPCGIGRRGRKRLDEAGQEQRRRAAGGGQGQADILFANPAADIIPKKDVHRVFAGDEELGERIAEAVAFFGFHFVLGELEAELVVELGNDVPFRVADRHVDILSAIVLVTGFFKGQVFRRNVEEGVVVEATVPVVGEKSLDVEGQLFIRDIGHYPGLAGRPQCFEGSRVPECGQDPLGLEPVHAGSDALSRHQEIDSHVALDELSNLGIVALPEVIMTLRDKVLEAVEERAVEPEIADAPLFEKQQPERVRKRGDGQVGVVPDLTRKNILAGGLVVDRIRGTEKDVDPAPVSVDAVFVFRFGKTAIMLVLEFVRRGQGKRVAPGPKGVDKSVPLAIGLQRKEKLFFLVADEVIDLILEPGLIFLFELGGLETSQ